MLLSMSPPRIRRIVFHDERKVARDTVDALREDILMSVGVGGLGGESEGGGRCWIVRWR
jgi:hypothetical protein